MRQRDGVKGMVLASLGGNGLILSHPEAVVLDLILTPDGSTH